MSNKFKNIFMQNSYNSAVQAFKAKSRTLFYPDGSECKGNSMADLFWKGFHNSYPASKWDAVSKQTLAYAFYKAGQDCAKEN